MTVDAPSYSQNPQHTQHIDYHLKKRGILKISLKFDDDDSIYLERLIRQLHTSHGHGLPITHSASRGWFWDVRPSPESSNQATARSETMSLFPWHTDCSYEANPPRFFALQVLQPDRCGGGTLSVLDTARLLSLLTPTARLGLAQPEFRITVPPEFIKDETQTHIVGPVLFEAQLRFRADIIVPLTPRAHAAFQELQDVLGTADAQGEVMHLTAEMLPRGSIVIMDNRRWLHARNAVLDPHRHLRRVRWDACAFGM
ncbi:Clavaminate synthase-like protein [Penicillium capsulatum]|uniref:Clavaminate synthase-like protein n=1 Tax=Penicillium capsulatum TaxID=69766 RepID=A0A9W9LM39_9EURO|nr:Clavaminate synthase-like protein [Penicillium capsulatum]KAJ6117722.1 Clavaminate synthase-like protein [Penicillium capsulatum]